MVQKSKYNKSKNSWLIMKIGFCGTMSVGKTTLVNALKELPEFADYNFATERSKYLNDLGIPLNTDSTLKGQVIFLAERAAELMNENIITDRTILDVMAFTQAAESINYYETEKFIDLARNLIYEYDYLFYVSPEGVDIEDNGVRTTDANYREVIDSLIKLNLSRNQYRIKKLVTISGTTEERISTIKETIFG
jgi:GTPase SAR1 family protein